MTWTSNGRPKVCLLTIGQPSTNPRLVKEADALVEAGFEVDVICGHWTSWADRFDPAVLSSRQWTCTYVGGRPGDWRYQWTRLRFRLGRGLSDSGLRPRVWTWALARVTPELVTAATLRPAGLYIAHNLGALPAAVRAARRHGARVGYDAEDLISGIGSAARTRDRGLGLNEWVESTHFAACDYLTAASPGIARAYTEKYQLAREPAVILNVFSLNMRPSAFRVNDPEEPLSLYWFSQTIGARRGLEEVLEAMAKARTPLRLHLRGRWQSNYRRHLYACAARLGLPEDCLIWQPPAHPDEMARLASAHDVGLAVEPSRDDNNRLAISNKLFVYLLAGNAVIATRTEGQQLICSQIGEACFSYAHGDVAALAGQFRLWSENRAALERARRQAWRAGEERYNWDREKHRFLSLVENTLLNRGAGSSGASSRTRRRSSEGLE